MTPIPPEVPSLPPRPRDAHKGSMGRVVIVGGSPGLTGAVCLAAHAALRSGAGLVTCAVARTLEPIIEVKCTEPMSLALADEGDGLLGSASAPDLLPALETADALVVGPGIGRSEQTSAFLAAWLPTTTVPCVLDADGLWHLSRHTELWDASSARILTPHEGELRRLLDPAPDRGDRAALEVAAEKISQERGVTVVLKGPGTRVTGSGRTYVNSTGNPGLATGGSGDVLAGMIGAFLARGDDPGDAAVRAVYLHGRAGDLAAERLGEESLIAGDLIEALPDALRELTNR